MAFIQLFEANHHRIPRNIVSAVEDGDLASDTEQTHEGGTTISVYVTPKYRAKVATMFLDDLEKYGREIKRRGIIRKGRAGRGPEFAPYIRQAASSDPEALDSRIPRGLPVDWYDEEWFSSLTNSERHLLRPATRSCPANEALLDFLKTKEAVRYHKKMTGHAVPERSVKARDKDPLEYGSADDTDESDASCEREMDDEDGETSNSDEVGSRDSENHDDGGEPLNCNGMEIDSPEEELTDAGMQQPHQTHTSRLSRHTYPPK